MHLSAIWRYPVKSMRGESLEAVELTRDGLAGDRIVQAYNRNGGLVTARTHPALLAHRAVLGPGGEPWIDGLPWTSAGAQAIVAAAVGEGASLRWNEARRFDILPLLVATDGSLEAFGHDPRRLRPNLIVSGVEGLEEREWEGRRLVVGQTTILLRDLRGRCVMTTVDPDTQAQRHAILQDIVDRFDGRLCLNASVVTGGPIAIGDPVQIL
jgi:MOSC domain-containing protein